MAKVDANISFVIFYCVAPVLILLLTARYIFGLTLKKLESKIFEHLLSWISRRYLEKDKQLLFEPLADLKQRSRGPFSILEIGLGCGENFKFYPKGTHFSCVEPSPHHDSVWKKRLENYRHIKLVDCFHTYAESMPDVKSDSYDVVVSTLTLCTVRDPPSVLKEIHRVLKPGGSFFTMEHVAGSKGSVIRAVQDLVTMYTPYSYVTGGCKMNRETWAYLDQSGFQSVQYRQYSINTWMLFFLRPFLYGTAVKKGIEEKIKSK
ncbi:hypothetical protein EGW08_012571 [Elysia chlorotica]|uniref:Methyltransferase type 11 domain-containing protein n=1 Tax=Elysia chlorotica TaxID=188477 RepID=A0A3S1C0M9_ELYCH|nr:hypothetical protein EGW08_012571 [Elysia chlorotica]